MAAETNLPSRIWLLRDGGKIRHSSPKEPGATAYVPDKDYEELLHWVERECGSTECNWREDVDGNWHTDCSQCFVLTSGSPDDNGMKFCCYCGSALVEIRSQDDD